MAAGVTVGHAWVLNLDADLELAGGPGYAATRVVLAAMAEPRAALARALLAPGDVLLEIATGVSGRARELVPRDLRGRAFCPTPTALAVMKRAGVEPEPHPPFEVLRAVNSRAFCANLGQTLDGARFVTSLEDAVAMLAKAPPIGHQWRAKRAFGMAGRGQRPIAPGVVSAADQSFLAASIGREGGIQIEPEVEIERELALHGVLAEDGTARFGAILQQHCDASGQWLRSEPITEVANRGPHHALRGEAARVAVALHAAGYFGPFGIDAFEYRWGTEMALNPRSEINARYSMGFPASGLIEAP